MIKNICPSENLYTHFQNVTVIKGPQIKITQVSINKETIKQHVTYSDNWILFGNIKQN